MLRKAGEMMYISPAFLALSYKKGGKAT